MDELVLCLSMAIDLDDDSNLFHGWHVAVLADEMARETCPQTRPYVFFAAMFHDLGGIGAPMHMLHHMGQNAGRDSLPPEVLLHPFYGARTVRIVPGLNRRHFIADIILQHHENVEGDGFPNGVGAEEIMPEATLVHAADLFDVYRFHAGETFDVDTVWRKLADEGGLPFYVMHAMRRALHDSDVLELFQDKRALAAAIKNLYAKHRDTLFTHIKEEEALDGLLSLVSSIIDHKHSYTQGHSARVASYSAELARYLGYGEEDVKLLLQAGLVHDVGKLSVPRSILDRKGKLEADSWVKMKRHAKNSWDVLMTFPSLEKYAFAALHHERWDGDGYPFGLAGVSIPVFSRIMAVADALDAMTSHRPYRQIWPFQRAIREIRDRAGSQFDPNIAEAAVECFCPGESLA